MTNLPFPVTPWPLTPDQMAILREAKARIDTDVLIVPVQALPGSPGRIFAWGVLPSFYCATAPVQPQNVNSVDSVEAALRFWLDSTEFDERFNEAWWLSTVMGCEVREVTDPFTLSNLEYEAEQRKVRFS